MSTNTKTVKMSSLFKNLTVENQNYIMGIYHSLIFAQNTLKLNTAKNSTPSDQKPA